MKAHEKAKIFKKFFPATDLMKKTSIAPNKVNDVTIKENYTGICNNKRNQFQLFNKSEDVFKKILSGLNINKPARMDQILVKFLKEVEDVVASTVYD